MNNNHEYTIFEENGAFFRGQGGGAEDLVRLVAVGDPFEVLMTAYDKKRKVLRQTTVRVSAMGGVLQTWVDEDDFLKIDRIAYKIAPAYLNRWVDVSSCDLKPIPQGTMFLWEVRGYSIAKELTCELPRFKRWGPKGVDTVFGVTSIFIPEDTDGFYPLSFTPAWMAELKKADQKSSSQTVSTNRKAEVQSDICPECGNYDGEHSSGCSVVASTESARAWAAGREQWEQFKNTRALQARSDICPACGKAEGEHSAGCPVVEFKANNLRELGVPGFLFKGDGLLPHQRNFVQAHKDIIDRRAKLKRQKMKIDARIRTMNAQSAQIEAQLALLKLDLNSIY